jgi:hypothetical protein
LLRALGAAEELYVLGGGEDCAKSGTAGVVIKRTRAKERSRNPEDKRCMAVSTG